MMQIRSSRGVQQDEVWAAADALIAEGLRPTIERVRQKMGRGSPNTVSPMLEAWFATLGARLGATNDQKRAVAGGGWPSPVQESMTQLWATALQTAQEQAAHAFLQDNQALAIERTTLQAREADLNQREITLNARHAASQEVLAVTRGQVVDLTTRLAQSQTAFTRLEREYQALQLRLGEADKQRLAEQHRIDEETARHAEERRRLEERATLNERRLMTELDRERQDAKRLKTSLKETEQGVERIENRFKEEKEALAINLREADMVLKSERQALAMAHYRATELRTLLDEQRVAHGAAMTQLSQRLSHAALKTPPRSGSGIRLSASNLSRRKLKSL